MIKVKKELKDLKERTSEAKLKSLQDHRLRSMETERDWFRSEALKLDNMAKKHTKIMNKMKTTLEIIEEDRDFFQEQLFTTKKLNKALNIELNKYKVSQGSMGPHHLKTESLDTEQPEEL